MAGLWHRPGPVDAAGHGREALAKAAGLAVRIIPTPGKLDASCGFSLRYELADEAALTALLDEKGLAWAALYHACRRGLRVTYTKCKEG